MNVAFYSTQPYDEYYFKKSTKKFNHELHFLETRLSIDTAELISGETAICAFVNDALDKEIISKLAEKGVQLIALRCAGYNNIDLEAAEHFNIKAVNVPSYSPNAVAEHTIGLMLSLNRHIPKAYNRVRDGNFSLNGLIGFDFTGRTAGIIGTGKIGTIVCRILLAFGMKVIAHDPVRNQICEQAGVEYVDKETLFSESDVISLHCPLNEDSRYMINQSALMLMKDNIMLINTSRGGLLDTCAIIEGLKSRKIGYLGLDVYEQERDLFFEDLSCEIIQDDIFERLLTFPNVLVTAHQAFLTSDALQNIADTTLSSITQFEQNQNLIYKI